MHTVALRTEATMPEQQRPANLGRAFKVGLLISVQSIVVLQPHLLECVADSKLCAESYE